MIDLTKIVLEKIAALGDTPAREYFGVSTGTISAWKLARTKPSILAAQKVLDEMFLPPVVTVAALAAPALPAPVVAEEVWEEPLNPYGVGPKEKVVILSPAYDGIEPKMMVTLFKCIKGFGIENVSIIPGNERTLIEEERNDLVAKYRRIPNKPEFCVFVDADHIFPCGNAATLRKLGLNYPEAKAARNALERIMSHPKDILIVGGLYKNRRAPHKPACEIAYRSTQEESRLRALFDPALKTPQSDKLEDTGWIGMGGMVRIHCSVFDRMEAASKNGGPLSEIAPPQGRESDVIGFFGRNSKFRGEDVFFCRRAAEIGIKTYVDTGTLVGHIIKGAV